jgi:hypothetical protein
MAITARPRPPAAIDDPAYQAYLTLRVGFVAAPILFGLDKFTNLLADWTAYLAPAIDRLIPGSAGSAMVAVGVVGRKDPTCPPLLTPCPTSPPRLATVPSS